MSNTGVELSTQTLLREVYLDHFYGLVLKELHTRPGISVARGVKPVYNEEWEVATLWQAALPPIDGTESPVLAVVSRIVRHGGRKVRLFIAVTTSPEIPGKYVDAMLKSWELEGFAGFALDPYITGELDTIYKDLFPRSN